MPLPSEIYDQIASALLERSGGMKPCVLCLTTDWIWAEGLVSLPMLDPAGPKVLPLLPLVCKKCGNTVLINLRMIGLADLAQQLLRAPNA